MNLRFEILAAVAKNPGAPTSEICDAIDYDRQKVTYSVRECAKAGLLSMRRDDVTGQPGYALTDAGKARLAQGPESQSKIGRFKGNHVQPAVTQNAGSSAPDAPACPTAAPVAEDEKPQTAEIPPQIMPEFTQSAALVDEIARLKRRSDDFEQRLFEAEAVIEKAQHILSDALPDDSFDPCDMDIDEMAEHVAQHVATLRSNADQLLGELSDQSALIMDLREQLAERHSGNAGDPVNHPPHYQGKVECIDAIEAALGADGFAAYCRGNAIKYTVRAGRKGCATTDLSKAAWYLARAAESQRRSG